MCKTFKRKCDKLNKKIVKLNHIVNFIINVKNIQQKNLEKSKSEK